MNLKEKVSQFNDLTAKFDAFKKKTEESLKAFEQNEELLKNKKIEAEKNFKEILPKII